MHSVGDTLLDVDNSLSGEIIRIGRELSDLKRALEQDELNSRKYATSAASVKTKSSAETQISTRGWALYYSFDFVAGSRHFSVFYYWRQCPVKHSLISEAI